MARVRYRCTSLCFPNATVAIFALLLAVSLSCKKAGTRRYANSATVYALSMEERDRLDYASQKGDGKAACRLYLYYRFSKHDDENAERYLRRSAELRDPDGVSELKNLEENGTIELFHRAAEAKARSSQ